MNEYLLKMMRYCAYRERSLSEVEQKLWDIECPFDWREKIVVELLDQDFLNEERYARSFVRGKFRIKNWGKVKIRAGLRKKKVAENLIDFAMEKELDQEEYVQKIEYLAEKKAALLHSENGNSPREKVRRYLVSKGYEWESIDKVLSEKAFKY